MEKDFFAESLSNFTKDFAYGGAIRHLYNRGYTIDEIIKEFHYPVEREYIEKVFEECDKNKEVIMN